MVEHQFRLAVPPRAAARTRATCRGKFAQVYMDPSYRAWLDEALPRLRLVAPDLPADVKEMDVSITTQVVVAKPKTTKRRRPAGDADNHEKSLWDAMTKVGAWWVDDEQIVHNETWKRWAYPGEEPGYIVKVEFRDAPAER